MKVDLINRLRYLNAMTVQPGEESVVSAVRVEEGLGIVGSARLSHQSVGVFVGVVVNACGLKHVSASVCLGAGCVSERRRRVRSNHRQGGEMARTPAIAHRFVLRPRAVAYLAMIYDMSAHAGAMQA